MSAPIRPHPVGRRLSPDVPGAIGVVPRRSSLPAVPGPIAVAGRLRLPVLHLNPRLADGEGQVDVRDLRSADVGDRGDDLPSDPDAVVDVVRGHLVPYVAEERDVRVGPAAGPGVRVI